MKIELVNTGSELMLGRVLNSHQQWICRTMADLGYVVERQVAIADTGSAIRTAVEEGLSSADLVITTGGLGPTSDDITRDLIADLLGLPLKENLEVLANIERFFQSRNRCMPASTRVQAMIPIGAEVLANLNGTAPGLAIRIHPSRNKHPDGPQWLVMLPGPPRELHPMFRERVTPLLAREYPLREAFVCRTLRTTGLGESLVEERIAPTLRSCVDRGLVLGYCARTGEVDVRLCGTGPQAEALVGEAEAVCRTLLNSHIFGTGDESLESVVVRVLTQRRQTVGFGESCTGGFVSNRVTNVPGASAVFRGSVIAYHNDVKTLQLGVPQPLISEHGAVSEPVAKAMAEGVRKLLNVDWAISVTGVAGPGGGTSEKPVGLVYIGLATSSGTCVTQQLNPFDRETFKYITSQQALNLLRTSLSVSDSAR